MRELRNLDRPGIGQFIRMPVQDIPVQPMRHRLIVILRKELDDRGVSVLLQVVQGGGVVQEARRRRTKGKDKRLISVDSSLCKTIIEYE